MKDDRDSQICSLHQKQRRLRFKPQHCLQFKLMD